MNYKKLLHENIINNQQFNTLEAIQENKIVSVYFELRTMLYVGILLFTSGIGYFTYKNIGEMGHIIAMLVITSLIIAGFYFIQKHTKPYSNNIVTIKIVYFDYVVLLTALLMISLLTYTQVYFNLVELLLNWTTYLSSVILFFMAYRFDNKILLSLAITSFAASVGLSVSPINWSKGNWIASSDLYIVSIFIGVTLVIIGHFSTTKPIKPHFSFTYQNFGFLLYFTGCLTGLFNSNSPVLLTFITLVTSAAITFYCWKEKSFLFFLYSNITFYISFSYLSFLFLDNRNNLTALIYYFPISCAFFLGFIMNNKKHFSND